MKIRYSNKYYKMSHSVNPKGRGRWLFEITFFADYYEQESKFVSAHGTLTEARKSAVAKAKAYLDKCGETALEMLVETMP